MSEPSGRGSPQPFAIFDRPTSSWRTSALSLALGNLPEPSVTFPRSGTWDRGGAYELPTSEHPTAVNGSSFLLPTPIKSDAKTGTADNSEHQLRSAVHLLPTPRTSDTNGPGAHGSGGPDLRTAAALIPTPLASDAGPRGGTTGFGLRDWSRNLLPTPTAARYGNNQSPSPGAALRPGLDSIDALLPTPRASDREKGGPNQRGSSGDLMLPRSAARISTGASTPPPSTDGHGSSDGQPQGRLF